MFHKIVSVISLMLVIVTCGSKVLYTLDQTSLDRDGVTIKRVALLESDLGSSVVSVAR
jgi:hypothetical protein